MRATTSVPDTALVTRSMTKRAAKSSSVSSDTDTVVLTPEPQNAAQTIAQYDTARLAASSISERYDVTLSTHSGKAIFVELSVQRYDTALPAAMRMSIIIKYVRKKRLLFCFTALVLSFAIIKRPVDLLIKLYQYNNTTQ